MQQCLSDGKLPGHASAVKNGLSVAICVCVCARARVCVHAHVAILCNEFLCCFSVSI